MEAKLYKNFAQKLLAVSLCAAMVLMGVLLGGRSVHVVEVAKPAIPNTMFLTKEALLALCEETDGGTGLLATGTDTDVKLRINVGPRPADVVYDYNGRSGEQRTATAGATTWLIAGSDELDGLVLYSEAPLIRGVFHVNIFHLGRTTQLLQTLIMAPQKARRLSTPTTGARVT